MLDKSKLIRKKRNEKIKRVPIGLRLPESLVKWIKGNRYSPTSIMLETCKELGWKE